MRKQRLKKSDNKSSTLSSRSIDSQGKPRVSEKVLDKNIQAGNVSPKPKSPSIYRFITDWRFMCMGVSMLLILLMTAFGLRYLSLRQSAAYSYEKYSKVQREIVFWQDITTKYSDYRDAYFELARLEYSLGNNEKAIQRVQKALELDPNFEKGIELEELLRK